jgi:hypothetical protein
LVVKSKGVFLKRKMAHVLNKEDCETLRRINDAITRARARGHRHVVVGESVGELTEQVLYVLEDCGYFVEDLCIEKEEEEENPSTTATATLITFMKK